MQNWKKIDKHRLAVFTDAIMAIIMTILVLDLKVPLANIETNHDLRHQLLNQLPHFFGFAISFSMIVIIWFSHHNLIMILSQATRTFAVLNFLFSGAIATLPFSTALVSEYPFYSLAEAILAGNMFLMNFFLAGMYVYIDKQKLIIPDITPAWYKKIKQTMGIAGGLLLLTAVFVSFISSTAALILIVSVPLMHCIPVRPPKTKVQNPGIIPETGTKAGE
jgi:uncharacterized membrane protein